MDHSETTLPTAHAGRRKVLVWGALGLIGVHVTQALLEAEYDVAVLCRSRCAYTAPVWTQRVLWFELDKGSRLEVLERAVAEADVIIDLAGASGAVSSNGDPIQSLDSICRSQLEFLEACVRAGRRPHVVFTSSRLVYGSATSKVVSEKQRVCPQSIYAAHKLCVENYLEVYAAKNALTFTTCRISNAYGPDPAPAGRGYKILNAFVGQSLAGAPITLFGTGEQLRDFIYVEDLAALLVRCCNRQGSENQVFNVGSGTPCRLVDAARIIRDLTDGPPLRFQPWPAAHLAVESGDYCSDITKARKLLGFHPLHSLQQGLTKTVRFHRPQTVAAATATPPHTRQLSLVASGT